MAYGTRICACCGSGDGVEEHHLFLKSQGCPDDLTVFLCHVCHGRAHSMDRRINIREATTQALKAKKDSGKVYSSSLLGYEDRDGVLVPVEEEQAIVREIKEMRKAGKTLRDIAADLNRRGIIGKRGGKFFAVTIKKILENNIHA